MIKMTSAEAQNRFGHLLDTAQREPVAITRHGRAVAFVVSARDMGEILSARERRAQMAEAFRQWRAKAAEEITPVAAALTEEDIIRLVNELR